MNTAMLRGLEQAVAELYARTSRSEGPAQSGTVSVKAYGATGNGVTDDAAAIQRAVNAVAGTGITLWFPAATYKVGSPVVLPNGQSLSITGYGATLHSTMAPIGSQTACIFRAKPTDVVNPGTLQTAPTLGLPTIVTNQTVAPTVGHWIEPGSPGSGQISGQLFKILAVTGGSEPFTVTLDRAVTMPFSSGASSTVQEYSAIPQHIEIYGLTFTGTGDRWIEILGGLNCALVDCHGVPDLGVVVDAGFSFDVGSRGCQMIRCDINLLGAAGPVYGLLNESNESSNMIACRTKNCAGGSGFLVDGIGNALYTCEEEGGSAAGILFGQGGGLGAIACNAYGCSAVSGFVASLATDVRFDDCQSVGAAVGLLVQATASGTRCMNFRYVGNSTATVNAIQAVSDLSIDGLDVSGTTVPVNLINLTGAGVDVAIYRATIASVATSNIINAESTFTGRLTLDDVSITLAAGTNGVIVQGAGAVLVASNLRMHGGGSGSVGVDVLGANSTFRQGFGCDLSAAATPVAITGFTNRFVQVLAGAATTVVPWPDLKSTDKVQLQVQSKNAGTLEGPYGITPTPGTGFTITPQGATPALDVSTLQVFIG